jgi:DNA-directed RNA polymerase subunit RPC12/RpoP
MKKEVEHEIECPACGHKIIIAVQSQPIIRTRENFSQSHT